MAFVFEGDRFAEREQLILDPFISHQEYSFKENRVAFNTGASSLVDQPTLNK